MVDFASTQAQSKGLVPSTSHKGSRTEAAAAEPLNASSPSTIDRVDRLYRQLVEIHTIAAVQLAECARWCRSDPTSSLVWAKTGWQGPTVSPSKARMALSPTTDFSS
jgi:hypothetical protein